MCEGTYFCIYNINLINHNDRKRKWDNSWYSNKWKFNAHRALVIARIVLKSVDLLWC